MKNPYLLFDLIFLLAAATVYTVAGGIALWVASLFWGDSALGNAFAAFVGYVVFVHAFILSIGLLRRCVQKPLREGEFPISMNPDYVAWGVNSVFHGIMISSPIASQVFFVFWLNWLYYRLMGMKLPLNTLIGTNTIIRQAELIEIGTKSVIGIGCVLVAHYSPDRSRHCHAKIRVGDNTLIGTHTLLSPGVKVGNNSLVGHHSIVSLGATIGNNVKIGPGCFIRPGVVIPDNVTIKANSLITKQTTIHSGDVIDTSTGARITPSATEPSHHDQS